MKRAFSAVVTALGLLALAGTTLALPTQIDVGADLEQSGWEMLRFDGIPETKFVGTSDGTLEIRAEKSSSVLFKKIAEEPLPARTLSWSWQVIDGLPATDLRRTDGDDRVASIYIGFPDGSLMSALRGMINPLAGGRVLTYVWGGGEVDAFPNPHLPDRGYIFIRRTADAPTHTWLSETVDLAADYRRAFGEDMPPVGYIGISGDSDDVGGLSLAKIRNIRFE